MLLIAQLPTTSEIKDLSGQGLVAVTLMFAMWQGRIFYQNRKNGLNGKANGKPIPPDLTLATLNELKEIAKRQIDVQERMENNQQATNTALAEVTKGIIVLLERTK